MIIRSEDMRDISSKILGAVDSTELNAVTETLQLKYENEYLTVAVTNKEYFTEVKLHVGPGEPLNASVTAKLFLKLISQITTDCIEFKVTDKFLIIKGNGTYKLPLIFEGDQLLELPRITINNPTVTFDLDGNILLSILNYNSKELLKGTPTKTVQRMYYIDEKGAITFVSGACVNSFTLPSPVKLLLNDRVVKLFKLFKNEPVKFTLGYDPISDDIIQTKVMFETDSIKLIAITGCDEGLVNSVPVEIIRGRAEEVYPYSITLNKEQLLQSISRLMLFNAGFVGKSDKPYSKFEFGPESVTIFDPSNENKETIEYMNSSSGMSTGSYTSIFDLNDLKVTLDSCPDQFVTLNFGTSPAAVLVRGNIRTVIPECQEV